MVLSAEMALSTYLHCLNDTTLACRGNLQFYTNLFAMRKQFREFNCAFYKPRLATNRCNFLPKSPLSRMRMCSLFGDPHLQRFDGTMQSCTEEGARPFVDNRHFLIQVTNANIRNEPHTTAVSKVTVLIRSHNCTRSLQYEASSDEETLPISFVDGVTHYNVDDSRTTVEIRANGDYVEIAMHHIHSSVHIRRRGPYLSVSVVVPENLQRSSPSSESLCTTGCRNRSIIAIDRALAASNQFAKCYSRKLHVPIKLAIDRCRSVQVTDQYFDACVFDLMLTGSDNA
uniref:Repulsive guidance molecule A n=1 Tax=Angiostrongylus cantonensis TaxID=6313 RepID=A0A158PAJ0_ANGCA